MDTTSALLIMAMIPMIPIRTTPRRKPAPMKATNIPTRTRRRKMRLAVGRMVTIMVRFVDFGVCLLVPTMVYLYNCTHKCDYYLYQIVI